MRTRVATICCAAILYTGAAACHSDITAGARGFQGELRLNLQALQGRASVLDSVVLTVQPSTGSVQRQGVKIESAQPEVSIGVRVPPGSTRFAAEVLSNTGSLLFSGETTAAVDADGFQVVVPVTARAPVMVASPDTVRMVWDGSYFGAVYLRNAGLSALGWAVDRSQLPFPLCEQQRIAPCLEVYSQTSAIGRDSVPVWIDLYTESLPHLPVEGVTLRLSAMVGPTRNGYVDIRLVRR